MAKQSSSTLRKRCFVFLMLMLSITAMLAFAIRAFLEYSCDIRRFDALEDRRFISAAPPAPPVVRTAPNPLSFMKSKRVLLVSHELSPSGGPLLLMELAFLLRSVGSEVCWITVQKQETDQMIHSLEKNMLVRGVQVFSAKSQDAIKTALKADVVVLNTAGSGNWLDTVVKEHVSHVRPKVLWWIHEMRSHYFSMDHVRRHLPLVAGAIVDSYVTADYWKNNTKERLRIKMPKTYVVHLGNSDELMEVAEDTVARRILREHVRESLGVGNEDILFGLINSVSRIKGQDLFLRAFYESIQLIREQKLQLPPIHAIIVGSDFSQNKFESELHNFALMKKITDKVHFVNRTLNVAPYLAAIDVLIQNSQGLGECFGRTTIEAMAFQLPVLGTAAGGTMEIVVNASTGLLHPTGQEGVIPLAKNMFNLATHVARRITMGRMGYLRVKEMFLEHHMSQRIAVVLKEVLE